jgi:hypothetical protein
MCLYTVKFLFRIIHNFHMPGHMKLFLCLKKFNKKKLQILIFKWFLEHKRQMLDKIKFKRYIFFSTAVHVVILLLYYLYRH